MSEVTLGIIGGGIVFVVGLITGLKSLHGALKEYIHSMLDDKFKSFDDKISALDKKVDKNLHDIEKRMTKMQMTDCKNYLAPFLADLERGGIPEEIEIQRFWEAYEVYINNGGNSYIKEKVDAFKREGKL